MSLSQYLIERIAKYFRIPSEAIRMFGSANKISGINKSTLPSELIPLNAIQFSRGLLNFTHIQSNLDWIYPFWIEQQYDPSSNSFIPRAHLGLSMNVTNRNWTATGTPDNKVEPIVDSRGMVTIFKNGWSVDVLLYVEKKLFAPSKSGNTDQRILNGLPVIETSFEFSDINLTLITYADRQTLHHSISLNNNSLFEKELEVIISVRPFNPEGISLINEIIFEDDVFIINKKHRLKLPAKPFKVNCSNFNGGDSINRIIEKEDSVFISKCDIGLANASAAYNIKLSSEESCRMHTTVPIEDETNIAVEDLTSYKNYWEKLLSGGARIETPDTLLNEQIKFSLSTLLLLTDNEEITPGPFTYHQFWFRDAAYMLWALDMFGFYDYSRKVISFFNNYQTKDGYFKSQKGEWDSNGQVLWIVYRHALLSKDHHFLRDNFQSLLKGVKWIDKKRIKKERLKTEPFFGLLPEGMSAEHLGVSDYYYWDNFWSLAGIKAFIAICELLGKEHEKNYAVKLYKDYSEDVEQSINKICNKYNINVIPASASRNIDCGMIGSVPAVYPLQIYTGKNRRAFNTIKTIEEEYFINGMFFQNFIHSGMNPYLTLQIAHAYLYAGERYKFWEIIKTVTKFASSTYTYPEAINPITGGGAMGDGHHGWAAAEFALALREAFVYESDIYSEESVMVHLLRGIPIIPFKENEKYKIENAPLSSGSVTIFVDSNEEGISIRIEYAAVKKIPGEKWRIYLPGEYTNVKIEEKYAGFKYNGSSEIIIEMLPASAVIVASTHDEKFKAENKEKENS